MDEPSVNSPSAETAQAFWSEAESLGRALADCLEYFEALGVDQLPAHLAPPPPARSPQRAAPAGQTMGNRPAQVIPPPAPAGAAGPTSQAPPNQIKPRKSSGPGRPQTDQEKGDPAILAPAAAGLEELERLIAQCRACPLGPDRPADPLPGRGSPRPLLVVVGPTPAIYDGPSGELLTAMIEKGLKLSAADYYVTSLVKCLPPDDSPLLNQADAVCRPFLMRQLALLAPKIVLALGKKPGQRLSGLTDEPLGLLRPRSHKIAGVENIWLRISYGLDDILASQKIKEATWQDLLRMRPGLLNLKKASSPAEP